MEIAASEVRLDSANCGGVFYSISDIKSVFFHLKTIFLWFKM